MSIFFIGGVLVVVMIWVGGKAIYQNIILPRKKNTHKCPHCGHYYKNNPYYCPNCGEVVEHKSQRR